MSDDVPMTAAAPEIVTPDEDEPTDQIDSLLACSNDPLRFVELAFPVTLSNGNKRC